MKITNKTNLAWPTYLAILEAATRYSPGEADITTTSLIDPPQKQVLTRRHYDETVKDASELMHIFVGQIGHAILEAVGLNLEATLDKVRHLIPEETLANMPDWEKYIIEKRFYVDIDGWKVGGQLDIYDGNVQITSDYKFTNVHGVKNGPKEEHVKQTNINAYFLKHGYELVDGKKVYRNLPSRGLQTNNFLRDWRKAERERDVRDAAAKNKAENTKKYKASYPEHQHLTHAINRVEEETVEAYLKERVALHKAARALPDDQLPECTDEERWADAGVWKVMPNNKKKSLRNLPTKEEAEKWVRDNNKSDVKIEYFPGDQTKRCGYCDARPFCHQYRKLKGSK